MNRRYIFALIAAVATGLPQGINAKPLLKGDGLLPQETVIIIALFGLFGGIAMAIGLIKWFVF